MVLPMMKALLVASLLAGCGPRSSTPPLQPPGAATASVHETYVITKLTDDGGTRVTTLAIDIPSTWHARIETSDGAPAFETSPNETVALLSILPNPSPDGSPDPIAQRLFDDAEPATLTRTEKSKGRVWFVDSRPDGRIHAALMAVGNGFVALCDLRLGLGEANQLEARTKICDSLQIVNTELHPGPDPEL
jgi:hypothetical protein